jgi:Asp-tRNAAsn/Glu-tRNAGln amidotransferase A subunit and related amidases
MATCVADAAALLAVLAAADPEDPVSAAENELAERAGVHPSGTSYSHALDPAALEGARLGVWRDGSAAAGPATAAVLDEVVARLRSLGAVLTDPVELPGADKIGEPEFAALHYEFKYGINAYLAYVAEFSTAGTLPGTLAELIDFNKRNADLVLSRFGQEIFEHPRRPAATWPIRPTWPCAGRHPAGPHRHLRAAGRPRPRGHRVADH